MNQGALPLMVFYENCNQVIDRVTRILTNSGFTVIESFDFQDAHANHSACACPYHGTDQCPCQLAILLVYGEGTVPVCLMVHGNDERTELSIIESPGHVIKAVMKAKITSVLKPGGFIFTDHESVVNVS